jgi:hypothetical protein
MREEKTKPNKSSLGKEKMRRRKKRNKQKYLYFFFKSINFYIKTFNINKSKEIFHWLVKTKSFA